MLCLITRRSSIADHVTYVPTRRFLPVSAVLFDFKSVISGILFAFL